MTLDFHYKQGDVLRVGNQERQESWSLSSSALVLNYQFYNISFVIIIIFTSIFF